MTGVEPSSFLSIVERREALLRALGDGPFEKPALEERLSVSRSTIDRGLRELEQRELASRDDEGYRRTLPGRIALEEYDRFRRRTEGLRACSDLFVGLDESVPLDGALLDGAEVVEATRASPGRPFEALYELVDRAESVRGFGPAVHGQQVETYRRRILEEGMEAELVLTDEAVDLLVSDYPEAFDVALASDRARFWRTDETLPYSVTLADTGEGTHVGVLVYADEGIQGCVLNREPAAVEWGERRYRELRESAEPFE